MLYQGSPYARPNSRKKNIHLMDGFKLLKSSRCLGHRKRPRCEYFSKPNKAFLCIILCKLVHHKLHHFYVPSNQHQCISYYLHVNYLCQALRWNLIIHVNWTEYYKYQLKSNCKVSDIKYKYHCLFILLGFQFIDLSSRLGYHILDTYVLKR